MDWDATQHHFALPLFAPLFQIVTSPTVLRALLLGGGQNDADEQQQIVRSATLREQLGRMRGKIAERLRETRNPLYVGDLVAVESLLGAA